MSATGKDHILHRLGEVKPGEQRDAVVGGHAAQHADAGELVGEELPVVVLQLADLLLVVGRDAVHRLRRVGKGRSKKWRGRERRGRGGGRNHHIKTHRTNDFSSASAKKNGTQQRNYCKGCQTITFYNCD